MSSEFHPAVYLIVNWPLIDILFDRILSRGRILLISIIIFLRNSTLEKFKNSKTKADTVHSQKKQIKIVITPASG